jgi:hypothetical protein
MRTNWLAAEVGSEPGLAGAVARDAIQVGMGAAGAVARAQGDSVREPGPAAEAARAASGFPAEADGPAVVGDNSALDRFHGGQEQANGWPVRTRDSMVALR